MPKELFCLLGALSLCLAEGGMRAQVVGGKAKPAEFVEVRPYGKNKYGADREWTGAIFRKLRRIRAAEGNAAAAARLPAAWRTYRQMRIDAEWAPESAFNTWGFWTWHEAQYDTGKDDAEWSYLLYRSIYDEAKRGNLFDWVMHVRPNVIMRYSTLSQWAQVRALSNEGEDYFASIGFNLDPNKLPSKGIWKSMIPFVNRREFPVIVPNAKHVVPWQRRDQKDPAKPIYMDNILVAFIDQLATEDFQRGYWDKAIERNLWVMEWCDAVQSANTNPDRKGKIDRDHGDYYWISTLSAANILRFLRYEELALEITERGIARQGPSNRDQLGLSHLEVVREGMLADAGKDSATVIAKMDQLIAREGKFPYIGKGFLDPARFVKADCLIKLGKTDEAEALLRSVCEWNARTLKDWMDAELELVDLMLHKNDLASAGKLLRELMVAVRINGVKIDELKLYMKYVDWAILSGDWTEALRAQREVMRLLESFRMTPLVPLAQAMMSKILANLGDFAESDRLAELARSGSVGREAGYISEIEKLLGARPKQGAKDTKSRVKIQPNRVTSVSLEDFPARAVVSLVNHGDREAKGILKVSGLPARISWDQESGFGVVQVSNGPGDAFKQTSGEIRIGAGAVALFSCVGNMANDVSKTVILEWNEAHQGSELATCEWMIAPSDKESEGAVIDAAEYTDDPFFLIPVYHHLQSKAAGPVNLRVVTSSPCRVEMYDGKGTLQMVDAEGNGSLEDRGDWLGDDRDRNLAADVLPDDETREASFMLQLDPKNWNTGENLKVRVEWLVDGKWFLAAENQVTFKQ